MAAVALESWPKPRQSAAGKQSQIQIVPWKVTLLQTSSGSGPMVYAQNDGNADVISGSTPEYDGMTSTCSIRAGP